MKQAMKSGIGTFTVEAGSGLAGSASLRSGGRERLRRRTRCRDREVDRGSAGGSGIDGARPAPCGLMREHRPTGGLRRENTTLAVVATNAHLNKVQASRVAFLAHHGFVRAIEPVHTSMDGDLCIALSTGKEGGACGRAGSPPRPRPWRMR